MTTKSSPATLERVAWTFPSVAAMKADQRLKVGDTVETFGYHFLADGGGCKYRIVAANTATADLGSYINLTGIDGQARAIFDAAIRVEQFGARRGDFDNANNFAAIDAFTRSQVNDDDTNPNAYGPTFHITGSGSFGLSSTVTIDTRSVKWDVDMHAFDWQSPATSPLLKFSAGAGYADYSGQMDCKGQCAGIWVIGGRIDIEGARISRFLNYGVKIGDGSGAGGGGGDSWIRGGHITQWSPEDPEFADAENYTGDCVVMDRQDCKIFGATLRWARRMIYATENSNTINVMNCHMINGGASVLTRENPIGIETEAIGNLAVSDCYLDNCQHIIRSRRSMWVDNRYIYLTDRVSISPAMILFRPWQDGAYPQIIISEMQSYSGNNLPLFRFQSEGGRSWPMPPATIEALVGSSSRVSMTGRRIEILLPDGNSPVNKVFATTSAGTGDGCRIALMDRDSGDDPELAPFIRSAGMNLALGAQGSLRILTAGALAWLFADDGALIPQGGAARTIGRSDTPVQGLFSTSANLSDLPESSAGLLPGDLWRDGEIVKVKL